jgi:catechol 2,3-dioxygenase-like lactoylglutathione lyase family enzyme
MKSIDVIAIPVTDQEKAKHFYSSLGFEVMAETPMGAGRTWLQMGLPGSFTTISLVTWFKKMPAGGLQGLVIRTDDLEEDVRKLRASGLEPGKIEEGLLGKFISFRDPDGNGLSLQQRMEEPAGQNTSLTPP